MSSFLLLQAAPGAEYGPPKAIAQVSIRGLAESSGIVASRAHPGVFWTHNDSGDRPWLYAITREGKLAGRWLVANAKAYDWEDIAAGPAPGGQTWLYVGDIGDNDRRRKFVTVYRVLEPPVSRVSEAERVTSKAEAFRLEYPDGPHDAECLMVHPRTGDLYIVTKAKLNDPDTGVYKARAPLKSTGTTVLRRVANVELPGASPFTLIFGRITGGDISPDGTRVILCDYLTAWEAVIPARIDDVWKGEWQEVKIGPRPQGEGICYRHDGRAVLATSEGATFSLIEMERRGDRKH